MYRMQMGPVRAQTGPSRAQTGPSRAQTGPKSQKTLECHISLKTFPNRAFEVFLPSTGNVDAKNTSNAQFGQVLSEI